MKKAIFWGALCTSCLGLMACSDAPEHVVKAPLVEVIQLPQRNNSDVQTFPAVVRAKDLTHLGFRISGEIATLPVKNGQQVKQGEVLATLDATNYTLAVQDRKAKVDLSKVQMERSKVMVAQGNMAKSMYDELEAQYRMALAEYNIAKTNLAYVDLVAPFDGIISKVVLENHETVQPGASVVEMHRIDKVELSIDLPDYVVATARRSEDETENRSLDIDVTLDSYRGETFKAKYIEHTAEQSATEKTYKLILEMPLLTNKPALQGMAGSIELDMSRLNLQFKENFLVPGEAVLVPDSIDLTTGKRVLWRLKPDNTVEQISVIVGGVKGKLLEVSGDLTEGDMIITRGQNYLVDGMQVIVKKEGSDAS
ncbi:efflux RND transporter periplasmic adaptor subunit [Echinimonas agarilytica]|uniref:Efflux RND transporter periplasmic adaptor subunit n=1 Tax=Echinimonas agarilytica TaxID=1215918 RepID=A0AA42B6Q1_9GAMM|nr:efflux RND transporter periplasmic adaptor subunit [Echinimonas agarilytica]MCM2678925.1 efflux RND transporter periplasmic adaptor subunit [Echinimonas agarilytica]